MCDVEYGIPVNVYSVVNRYDFFDHPKPHEACPTVEASIRTGITQRVGVFSSIRSVATDIAEIIIGEIQIITCSVHLCYKLQISISRIARNVV